jgi:hypothetical protein
MVKPTSEISGPTIQIYMRTTLLVVSWIILVIFKILIDKLINLSV